MLDTSFDDRRFDDRRFDDPRFDDRAMIGQGASKAKGLAVFGIAYKPLVGASGGPFDGAAAV
jgi:hypothetical protein